MDWPQPRASRQPTIGNRYGALLQWVHESKWYRASQPSNPTEKEIWDCRAALVDVFVYQA